MLVYLRTPAVCFLLSMDEMSCKTKDKPYADIRKKSKSCHHKVLAYQQDRKEASGLGHEARASSHHLCQMGHFYTNSTVKTSSRTQHPSHEVMTPCSTHGKGLQKGRKKTKNKSKPKNNLINQFHNNDSALVSGMSLHLASSFLFSTLRTHASSVICLMLHSLPSRAKTEHSP